MATALLPAPLWDFVEPFLPITPRRLKGGRPRVSDRACLTGILFVLRSGMVERTFPWLNQFRRLRVRYDKRADIHEAFLSLGCALICWRSLRTIWMTG